MKLLLAILMITLLAVSSSGELLAKFSFETGDETEFDSIVTVTAVDSVSNYFSSRGTYAWETYTNGAGTCLGYISIDVGAAIYIHVRYDICMTGAPTFGTKNQAFFKVFAANGQEMTRTYARGATSGDSIKSRAWGDGNLALYNEPVDKLLEDYVEGEWKRYDYFYHLASGANAERWIYRDGVLLKYKDDFDGDATIPRTFIFGQQLSDVTINANVWFDNIMIATYDVVPPYGLKKFLQKRPR